MLRLIDANGIGLTLVKRGQSDKRFKLGDTIRYTPSEVQQIINEDIPIMDAVPIVRCKDCKHKPIVPQGCKSGFDIEFPDNVCPCQCDDKWYSWGPDDNWFCGSGEPKEEKE